MSKNRLKGIIFDLDGLMFNTESLYLIAEKELAKRYGEKFSMNTFRKMQGLRTIEAIEVLAKHLKIKKDPEKLLFERNVILNKFLLKKLQPMPGLFELIKFLKQEKLELAIATSSISPSINIYDKKFNFKKYFSVIVTAEQVKKGKPSPEVFLKAAIELKLKPRNLLVLEDATNGLLAAKRGGFQCVIVRDKYHRLDKFRGADLVVTKLDSLRLLNYIKKYV